MSYSAGEARILALVRLCTGFSTTNTSQSDWKILSSGKDDNYSILRPAGFGIEWVSISVYQANYKTIIEVWQRYIDETTSKTTLYGHIAALFAILAYPHGGDNSMGDLTIRVAEEPKERWSKDGGPLWLSWDLEIDWNEQTQVTFAG